MITSKSEPLAWVLNNLPAVQHYCVAYSGGLDSHVLLHLLATRRPGHAARLTAVHVDHQIHPDSADWTRHCDAVSRALGIAFVSFAVDARPQVGESPEAAARQARYRVLADWLPADALLLTGQHRDDQAETLLLQLFRGAGPRGLAAMPALTALGRGRMARPLLATHRAQLRAYAERHDLRWIEDPSNADLHFDRNRLRHQVLPSLRQHWPGLDAVLARAAGLQADQAELAGDLAELDRHRCAPAGTSAEQLDCAAVQRLSRARALNVLRNWLESNGLPLPSARILEQVRDSVLNARPDASPCVRWPGAEVRRYRRRLYALAPLTPADTTARLRWDLQNPLPLPQAGGVLSALAASNGDLRHDGRAALEVRFRQGGEMLRPAGRREHHRLKHLFQEWCIPEWERARVPLIYAGDELIAVAGLCVCDGHRAAPDEPGYRLVWSRLA